MNRKPIKRKNRPNALADIWPILRQPTTDWVTKLLLQHLQDSGPGDSDPGDSGQAAIASSVQQKKTENARARMERRRQPVSNNFGGKTFGAFRQRVSAVSCALRVTC